MRKLVISIFFICTACNIFLLSNSGYAAKVDESCNSIESIFAPGSGQSYSKTSDEYDEFDKAIKKYVDPARISRNTTYRLGTEYQYGSEYGGGVRGYRYPAVPVNPIWSLEGAANSTVAYLTGGNGGGYGWSVDNGVKELELYLNHRYDKKCPNTTIIIGGYSQGAHVVGTLFSSGYNSKLVGENIRKRIAYITLFGDPKLNLPEGGWNLASWGRRVACYNNSQNSWWRGDGIDCAVTAGSLGARKPYFTNNWMNKAMLWCYKDDPVCDVDSSMNNIGDHFQYANSGRIENGVREALFNSVTRFSGEQRNKLLASVRNNGSVPNNQIYSNKPINWSSVQVPWKEPDMQRRDPLLPCTMMFVIDTSLNEEHMGIAKMIHTRRAKEVAETNKCALGLAIVGPVGANYYSKIILQPTKSLSVFLDYLWGVKFISKESGAPIGSSIAGTFLRTPPANSVDTIINDTQ